MKVERRELKNGFKIIHNFTYDELKELKKNEVIMKVVPLLIGASLLSEIKIIRIDKKK
jgi:hypothetical protein